MNKETFSKALKEVKENSKERKFKQTLDLIINFKELDLKKNNIDVFITLPASKGKETKVCIMVDEDLKEKAKEAADKIILKEELTKLDKKEIKTLAKEYDFFISQANLMGQVATTLGRILGPLGKMPNPKVGGVITPQADVKNVVQKFKKTVRIMTKNEPSIKVAIGKEDMEETDILANITSIYDHILPLLPKGEHNIKSILLKTTMGKPIKIKK